jgi:hypothetical protein
MIDNSRDFIRKKLTDHTGITGNSQYTLYILCANAFFAGNIMDSAVASRKV